MRRRHAIATLLCLAVFARTANANLLKVGGPNSEFDFVQDAIDIALSLPGEHEIRVSEGIYSEHLVIPDSALVTRLWIRGGWNANFAAQTLDGKNTVIDGQNLGRTLDASARFDLEIEGLTFRHGRVTRAGSPDNTGGGAGIRASVHSGSFLLHHCRVEDSTTIWNGLNAQGGGISLNVTGRVEIFDCEFNRNVVRTVAKKDQYALGSAINGFAYGSGEIKLARILLVGNKAESKGGAGPSLSVYLANTAVATAADVTIAGTRNKGPVFGPQAVLFWATQASRFDVRRLHVTGTANSTSTASSQQVGLVAFDSVVARFSDSLIAAGAQGARSGLAAASLGTAAMRLINLTIADHDELGADLEAGEDAVLSLVNSIVSRNGTSVIKEGPVKTAKNLIGKEPKFVDTAQGNYRLSKTSPAANKGSNVPTGTLSTLDLDRKPRVKSGKVDIGAYESQ